MADSPKITSQTNQGKGPLGQSGISPSGTVQRNFQNEFVSPKPGPADVDRQVPCSPKDKGPTGRR
jgi:hypothetical protein